MFGICVALIGVTTVALSILNVGVFHWGLIGVAVANLLPLVVVCGVIIPRHVDSKLGLSWRERAVRVWRPVLLGCLPSLVLLVAWKQVHPPATWSEIIAIIIVTALVMALAGWRFGLDRAERGRLAALLQRKWPTLRAAGA